ncbi:MAG: DUF2892 domain-containing protein [Saprospiraceae bacterium]|nr:DUF2892 domain-containing protein [Saprospiraceae bacterium]
MKRNIGKIDRILRMTIAALLVLLVLSNRIIELPAIAAVVISILLFLTGLYGFSPIYSVLKLSTKK